MTRPLELQRTNGTSRTRPSLCTCKLASATWHVRCEAQTPVHRRQPLSAFRQDTASGAPRSQQDAAAPMHEDSSDDRDSAHASADDTPRELPLGSAGTSVPASLASLSPASPRPPSASTTHPPTTSAACRP